MARRRPRQHAAAVAAGEPPLARRWGYCLLIAVAGIVVYANALTGPFLFDDRLAIGDNASIRHLWPLTTVLRPPLQIPFTARPLVNLSFALNFAVGGFRVEGLHAVNIGIHVLAALALFGVLRRTFARTSVVGGGPSADRLALGCALAWVVHPLNSETVNYLTQRTELLMALFYLVTLYAAIRALGPGSRRWTWVAGLSAFCAVGSKETALTLPVVILLWDRIFVFEGFADAWRQRRRLYAVVAASWALFAFFVRDMAFFNPKGFDVQVSRWTYLLNQAPMIARYLGLGFWPRALVFDYGIVPGASLGAVWPAGLGIAALLAATVAALVRVPQAGFWGAWFFITLAPASSIIPIPTEVGAERRMYLPLIAVLAVVALAVHAILRRARTGWPRTAAFAVVTAVLLALAAATVRRNVDYRSGLVIWQTVLDRWPHARAHQHFSMFLRDAGRTDESIAHLRIAAPTLANARHALASALLERGEVKEAVAEFRAFVTQNPDAPRIVEAREEFAVALSRAGDTRGVVEQFRAITERVPDYARGHVGLADALLQQNDVDGASREYRRALDLQPNNVRALANLGLVLAAQGEGGEALSMLRRALELEPRALPPRRHVVRLLLQDGKPAEAEKEASALVAMTPNDPEAHNLLGITLASQQRFDAAGAQFRQALALDPSHQEARANLARLTALQARGR